MLKLQNITKNYLSGENTVRALKGVNLEFRQSEFVCVLGPSGCGKTTLLNIIGGLDRYTGGDILINGKSTKGFTENDWDTYRNNTIGFVFQNYNLIQHISVIENVEMALTLSGVPSAERVKRARQALLSVGLEGQAEKKPNQLSGGQMQRVAIARALVNNPKILLADEPTGALDSVTSIQIMELLKEISADRLVIMVTHNTSLASKYGTRIVSLSDGAVTGDTNPYQGENSLQGADRQKYSNGRKTSMTFFTALRLSFNNLKTKKLRTILTSVAGSIGIIGIALVLAIGNGMTLYVNDMQTGALSGFPLMVNETYQDFNYVERYNEWKKEGFTDENVLYPYDTKAKIHTNVFTQDYLDYVNNLDKSLYNSVSYSRSLSMVIAAKMPEGQIKIFKNEMNYKELNTNLGWQELPSDKGFILSQYDLLYGEYPSNENEIVLVTDKNNSVNAKLLNALGIEFTEGQTFRFEDFVGLEIKQVSNDAYYSPDESNNRFITNLITPQIYQTQRTLTITGILRIKKGGPDVSILNNGIAYTPALTEAVLSECMGSQIVEYQKNHSNINVLTGNEFSAATASSDYKKMMMYLGGDTTPSAISIYPVSFDAKEKIKEYLDAYNADKAETDKIFYSDLAETVTGIFGTLIDTISIILSAFAGISLVVSSIMIGIITYVSVVERTKEIGILRSIGARKKDISRVFNAETVIIGFTAGVIGIFMTFVLSLPVNIIVNNLVQVENIARLPLLSALILVAVSVFLTLTAGLIPSRIAARKDPVAALRTE